MLDANQRTLQVLLASLVLTACGDDAPTSPGDGLPPGADIDVPFPIDRGDDGTTTPGTYKGLPLRLVDNGAPDVTPVDGVIGVICVGMSNANQECAALLAGLGGEWADQVDPEVRVVNCAVGGRAIERWIDPAFDDVLWDACLGHKIANAGVRPDQVRVIYHKAASQFGLGPGGEPLPTYPAPESDYFAFRGYLSAFADRVATEIPSVQAVYTSSRSYGGFNDRSDRGEPLSYEEGQGLNQWLGSHPSVDGVWYGWGAYLWAPDCASGETNGSGTCYVRSDYQPDGVHPSASGRERIAALWHARLLEDTWYRR